MASPVFRASDAIDRSTLSGSSSHPTNRLRRRAQTTSVTAGAAFTGSLERFGVAPRTAVFSVVTFARRVFRFIAEAYQKREDHDLYYISLSYLSIIRCTFADIVCSKYVLLKIVCFEPRAPGARSQPTVLRLACNVALGICLDVGGHDWWHSPSPRQVSMITMRRCSELITFDRRSTGVSDNAPGASQIG